MNQKLMVFALVCMVFLGIVMSIAAVGLMIVYFSSSQSTISVTASSTSQSNVALAVAEVKTPVPTVSYAQTCHGWNIHLWGDVERKAEDPGWMILSAKGWWQNVSAESNPPAFDTKIQAGVSTMDPPETQSFYEQMKSVKIVTAEGYTYSDTLNNSTSDYYYHGPSWIDNTFAPKGLGYSVNVSIRVSASSTGWKMLTPCGTLDFAHPEANAPILDTSKLPAIGKPIEIANGKFTVTFANMTSVNWIFKNLDKGQDNNFVLSAHILGTHDFSEPFDVKVGPGLTTYGNFEIAAKDPGNSSDKVLVFQQLFPYYDSSTGLTAYRRGVGWAVLIG